MTKQPTSLAGVVMMGAGTLFVWSGIKGTSILGAIQNLIIGQPIGVGSTIQPLTTPTGGSSSPDAVQGVAPAGGSNREIGQRLAAGYGWTGGEWDALDKLWTRESSWNNHAENPSSHAYGIPQALPYTKLPTAGRPERAGGKSDATAQIQWGLDYIRNRYGRPSMAWAHETANSWY